MTARTARAARITAEEDLEMVSVSREDMARPRGEPPVARLREEPLRDELSSDSTLRNR